MKFNHVYFGSSTNDEGVVTLIPQFALTDQNVLVRFCEVDNSGGWNPDLAVEDVKLQYLYNTPPDGEYICSLTSIAYSKRDHGILFEFFVEKLFHSNVVGADLIVGSELISGITGQTTDKFLQIWSAEARNNLIFGKDCKDFLAAKYSVEYQGSRIVNVDCVDD